MNKMPCVELCPDCPLRDMLPGGPEAMDRPLFLEKVGERVLDASSSSISNDGRTASLSIEYGGGPRMAEVAILSEGVNTGPAFWVREATWTSGAAQTAFEDCDKPTQIRYGFLNLSKQAVCQALKNIK